MAVKTRVNVRAWSETTLAGVEYYVDGQKLFGVGGAIPLANLADWTRGDLIVGGAAQWEDFAHPGAAGNILQTTALDMAWTRDLSDLQSIQFDLTPSVTPSEGLLYWNDTDKTLNLTMSGGNVNMQIGQEMLIRAKAAETILNGQLVYISSGTGSQPIISLAKADAEFTSAATIAMATETISINNFGYVTTMGLVRDVDTNSYTAGTILYLSAATAGAYTSAKPTAPNHLVVVGVVVRQHATEGVIYVRIENGFELSEIHDVLISSAARGDILTYRVGGYYQNLAIGVAGEYVGTDGTDVEWRGAHPDNGFVNRTDSSLAMSSTNLRIAPTGAGFAFYSAGKRYLKTTNQDVAIANDLTQHYVYFDTSGVIQVATTPWAITSDNVPAATVYKDGTTYAISDERHGYLRDRYWHQWAHDTIGARYESGLSGTFGDTTFSIAQGVVHDEDIELDTGGAKTACRLWYRHTGAAAMRFESNVTRPWKLGATPAPQYDDAGTLTDVSANRYFCSYVYATNDIDYPIYIVVGQAQYTTVAGARNDSLPATPGILTREWKLLYRVIYQRNGASATYTEASDFREVSTGPGSSFTPASHTSLTNRDAANSHPASAVTETTTIGRLMQGNATTGALEASTVVKSGAGVLTFSAGSAYTLTVEATGAAVLRAAATVLTAGRIPFVSDGNTIADDAALVWDNTNKRLGVNCTPGFQIHVENEADSTVIARTYSDTSNVTAIVSMGHARGTQSSPTASQSGDTLARLSGVGYGASAWSGSRAVVEMYAAENWTATAQGAYITFRVAAIGATSLSEAMRITAARNVLVGTTTSPGGTATKALIFGDNAGDPAPGSNTAGLYAKDVSGTVEMFAVDEAGNTAQLTPHNYAGPVQPLRGVLHWSQYHRNDYAGVEKWYDMERALLALEELTGDKFVHTRKIRKTPKPAKTPGWLKSFK